MSACTVPFKRLEIDFNGDVWLCCPTWLPTSIGNIINTNLNEILMSKNAQSIQNSVIDGSYRYCTKCPFLPAKLGKILDQPPLDKNLIPDHWQIEDLHLSYDRSCNLACPSCRKQKFCYGHNGLTKQQLDIIHSKVLTSDVIKNTKRLHITGSGDPFASEVYFGFLRSLSKTQYPHLKITLYTNGLLFNPLNWKEIGNNASNVDSVEVSIDASDPETYALNRGGNWNTLCQNLNFMKTLRFDGKLNNLRFSFVVQENNFREMLNFIQFAFEKGADRVNFLELINLGTYEDTGSQIKGTWQKGLNHSKRAVHLVNHPAHNEFTNLMKMIKGSYSEDRVLWIGFQYNDMNKLPPNYKLDNPTIEPINPSSPTIITWQDIPGYFDFHKIYSDIVSSAQNNARFVEMGVLFGRSTAYMANLIAKSGKTISFDAIDRFDWNDPESIISQYEILEPFTTLGTPPNQNILTMREEVLQFKSLDLLVSKFLKLAKLDQYVNLIKSTGQKRAIAYENNSLDFVFVDTEHTYNDTLEILRLYLPKIKSGGILAGHDYYPPYLGHIQAVKEILGDKIEVPPPWTSFIYRKP